MRTDTVFKSAYNDALDLLGALGSGRSVPSENVLSKQLNVSRTTTRKIIARLLECGVLAADGRPPQRVVIAVPDDAYRYPETETVPTATHVEQCFMEWMLRDNAEPGTSINEMEMSRRFGVATTGIREFLNRFQGFGLIEKRPKGGWVFRGFTNSFAIELCEIREMFEVRSAKMLVSSPVNSPHWQDLAEIREEHVSLLKELRRRYHDFSGLDRRFHLLINSASPNRFINSFYDIITMIFHYHYQWNKADERQRNEAAILEHIAYIDALFSRDITAVEAACRLHLKSAKETLMRSTLGRSAVPVNPGPFKAGDLLDPKDSPAFQPPYRGQAGRRARRMIWQPSQDIDRQ